MTTDERNVGELLTAYSAGERNFSGWSIKTGVLANETLEGCTFDGSRFQDCAGAMSRFINCSMEHAEFTHCALYGFDFDSSSLHGSTFKDCILDRASFFMSMLPESSFAKCSMRNACFLATNLSDVQMSETHLGGSLFGRTKLTANSLFGPDFTDCVVALPHDIADGELRQLGRMAYVIETMSQSNSESPGGIPVKPELMHSMFASLPHVVEFLRRGGVSSDWLVPIEVAIGSMKSPAGRSVFVSYSTDDQEFARILAAALARAGLEVWFAPKSMRGGRKLHDQLMREIDGTDRVVLVVSQSAMVSGWVQTEIRRALASAKDPSVKRIVPVLLVNNEEWRSWSLVDPDSGRDLALQLRDGPSYSFAGLEEGEAVATITRLINELTCEPSQST